MIKKSQALGIVTWREHYQSAKLDACGTRDAEILCKIVATGSLAREMVLVEAIDVRRSRDGCNQARS